MDGPGTLSKSFIRKCWIKGTRCPRCAPPPPPHLPVLETRVSSKSDYCQKYNRFVHYKREPQLRDFHRRKENARLQAEGSDAAASAPQNQGTCRKQRGRMHGPRRLLRESGRDVQQERRRRVCRSEPASPGESANAVPHYHKLCSRVSRIWGNRRGQHIRSAMDKPRPGKTTFVIMVSPLPGKYEILRPRSRPPSRRTHL